MKYGTGVLPSQIIREMIAKNIIKSEYAINEDQIQPASLDLRLAGRAIRVRASFLTGKSETVIEKLEHYKMHEVDLSNGAVLEKGCVYVIPLLETLNLPSNIQAVCNAKSSTGRLDLLTRVITNEGVEFDRVETGYIGPLYVEICPRSFSVLVRPGMRLNQIRFRSGSTIITDIELKTAISYFKKVISPSKQELQNHKDYLKSNLKKKIIILCSYKIFILTKFYFLLI